MSAEQFSSPETAECVLDLLRKSDTASIRDIASALGVGRSTAHRAIHRLLADGTLQVVRQGTGAGYPTTYQIGAES